MSFRDSLVRGVVLIREAIESANFVTGVSGWTIRKDGTVEFASAVIRGLVEIIGSSGAKIRLDPTSAYPVIRFFSPDGTANAFIRIVTGLAGSKANLEMRSGSFTDVDGIARTFIVQLNENNTAFRFVGDVSGLTSGGMFRALTHSAYFGVEDASAVLGAYIEVRNDTVPPRISFRNTDVSIPTVAVYNRLNRVLDTSHVHVVPQETCSVALTLTTTNQDVPGCTSVFNTNYDNAIVVVSGSFEFETTVAVAGGVTVGQISFDGTDLSPLAIGTKTIVARQSSAQTWIVTVPTAGSHTVKLRARSAGTAGGTARVNVTQTTVSSVVYEQPV